MPKDELAAAFARLLIEKPVLLDELARRIESNEPLVDENGEPVQAHGQSA